MVELKLHVAMVAVGCMLCVVSIPVVLLKASALVLRGLIVRVLCNVAFKQLGSMLPVNCVIIIGVQVLPEHVSER